jgi:hypothetical protein
MMYLSTIGEYPPVSLSLLASQSFGPPLFYEEEMMKRLTVGEYRGMLLRNLYSSDRGLDSRSIQARISI